LVQLRKSYGKYYLMHIGMVSAFLLICLLVAYFSLSNVRLSEFGVIYFVMVLLGLVFWNGDVESEGETIGAFVITVAGMFTISSVVGGLTRQWSFLAQLPVLKPQPLETTFLGWTPSQILTVLMNVPGPFAEEGFFRVFLWRITSPAIGRIKAIFLQAIVFGAFHYFAYGADFGQMITAVAIGIFLGFVYSWLCPRDQPENVRGELVVSASHLIYNLATIIIGAFTGITLMRI
jgi:membrane protease YdiL (CAAX protease family)